MTARGGIPKHAIASWGFGFEAGSAVARRSAMTDRRSEDLTSILWFSAQFGTLLVVGPIFATLVAVLGASTRAKHRSGPRTIYTGSAAAAAFPRACAGLRAPGMTVVTPA